jgi:hypothetical protein
VAEGREEDLMATTETGRDGGTEMTAPTGTPGAGQMQRQEFGASSITTMGETSTAALAAREKAMVEARFIMAMRRPRDWDDVRAKLLRACERPGFAGSLTEKVWGAAWYRKPVGEGVEGFSVRFAEEAMRAMGNMDILPATVYEDAQKRIVTVMVLDLETNNSVTTTLTIDKTVERKTLKKGEVPIRSRPNSQGQMIHILLATDDEVFSKQQNLVSKARRTGILQILPGDIAAECRLRILAIRNGEAAKDPDKLRRTVADGFAAMNVPPSQLKEYLGHELATSTPAELADLRDLWEALKKGETTWADVIAAVRETRGQEAGDEPPATDKPKAGLDGVTERLQNSAAAVNAPPSGPVCPDHATQTIENGDGSRACFVCKWTAPAPTNAPPATADRVQGEDDNDATPTAAADPQAAAASTSPAPGPFRDEKKAAPATKPPRQGRLQE